MTNIKALTKAELIALLAKRDAEVTALRTQVSTLQGELALRPRAQASAIALRPGQVVVIKRGQSTQRRWVAA